jgi:hypothetical protein
MRLKDILQEMKAIQSMQEMALKNTGLVGDFTKDGSFKGPDRKIHLGKNRVSQLQNFFKNTEIDFNIVFFNSPIYSGYSGLCFSTEQDLIDFLKYRMRASDDEVFKTINSFSTGEINMLVTNNEGNLSVPLSPWIVAHRISHALSTEYTEYEYNFKDVFVKTIIEMMNAVFDSNQTDYQLAIDDSNAVWYHHAAHTFGTMRSATTKKIVEGGGSEFFHELFAQYIYNGKVIFKHSGFSDINDGIFDLKVKDNIDDAVLINAEHTIAHMFKEALVEAKGNYYVL